LITWPEAADQDARNPILIERFLQRIIDESQVTLLGELDLDSNSMYGGTSWTYSELASFLFQLPIIQSQLSSMSTENWMYPATVVVWAVSQVQHLEDGGELWTTSNFKGNKLTKLAEVFSASVAKLGLETFEERLIGSQRHLTLARLHSIIPNYALEKYSAHIKWIDEYHKPLVVGYQRIIDATDFPRSVKKLFEAHPDISLDLLDRSVQTRRTGVDAGLPPRIADALISGPRQQAKKDLKLDNDLPKVKFDDAAGELFLADWLGWSCQDIDGNTVNSHSLPASSVNASNETIQNAPLIDLGNGYLIFDGNGTLIRQQRSLPASGGIILWNSKVTFNEDLLATESFGVTSWPGWRAGWFENLPRLQLKLEDGTIRNLSSKNSIEIENTAVSHVYTLEGSQVYSRMPSTTEGQLLTIVDHVENSRKQVGPEKSPVATHPWGEFDVTLYAGLGRSKELTGFSVPELELIGSLAPLLPGEERTILLDYESSWSGDTEIVLSSDMSDYVPTFTLIDPSGAQWKFELRIEKLNWSIEFDEQVPEMLENCRRYPLIALKKIKRLVMKDVAKYDPKLIIRDSDVAKPTVLTGMQRFEDISYDLRLLREVNSRREVSFILSLSGSTIEVAVFINTSNRAAKRKMNTYTDLSELRLATIQSHFFTEADWLNFEAERRKESEALKLKFRERRR
jgi:hypothetical protein